MVFLASVELSFGSVLEESSGQRLAQLGRPRPKAGRYQLTVSKLRVAP